MLARQVIPCDGISEIVRCFVRLATVSRARFFSTIAGDLRGRCWELLRGVARIQ